MSVKMKTPSAMKDSGIEWIGEIPEHWEIVKGKYLFTNIKEIVGKDSDRFKRLALTLNGVIERDKESSDGLQPINFDTYQIVKENNLIFKLIDLQNISTSRVGLTWSDGIMSSAYIRLVPVKNINIKFYENFYLMMWYYNIFNDLGDAGVRSNLNATDLLNIQIPYPPIEEQRLIAVQLNQICGTLDNTKADIEKQIEILNEYKKSVITEAVTKGLDKNVELKDSFNEFIEKIPKHWKLMKAKYIAKTIFRGNGITKEQVIENGNIQCIRYGEIYSKYDNSIEHCVSKTNLELINSPKYIQYEDILFAVTGELVEEIGKNVIYLGNEACLVGGDILVLRPEGNAKYLNYALNCKTSQEQKSFGKAKLKVVHNSLSDIGNMCIPYPPIEEQKEIADYLDLKCSEIDSIIETKKQQLELLEEYKKSIIYEYVTGKREVSTLLDGVSAKPDFAVAQNTQSVSIESAGDSHNE